eukprot:6585479-Prymnesium_polylepis.1
MTLTLTLTLTRTLVFLFTDTQVKEESMVEDINNILNAGEVPNLFPSDEKSQIAETLAGKAKEIGWTDTTPSTPRVPDQH